MDKPGHDVAVRSARDRLIDLLGIGDAYPLTDLNVVADQLKVPFGGTAKIPIEHAQAGVTYRLCDPKGQALGDQFKAEGDDGTVVIETPSVTEDVTYRIQASKKLLPGSKLPAQPPRFLDEGAPVKVGLDTGLVIEIVQAPLLDPANANPRPSDPRIVPYGASVDVRVNNSQEGVEYSLILDGKDVKDVVRTGNLAAITLPTGPMHEDSVIQVRATKNFLAAENRSSETEPLDAKLFLKVIANPGLAVTVDSAPIIDYGQDVTIKVAGTQRSANYRAHFRTIPDRDFLHGTAPDADMVTVPVAGKPDVQVRKPPRSDVWRDLDGYAVLGEAPVPGSGGDLAFAVKALADDTIVIVQAIKEHQIDAGNPAAGSISSSIRLEQAAVALVRPDPARPLALRVPLRGAQTGDTMQVSNGQPGVFYHFRLSSESAEFPRPAYFHKRDDADATQNKGVGQLGIEIDFALAADPEVPPAGGANRAVVYPRPPLLGITPFAAGSSLSIRAVKAQSGVEARKAQLAPVAAVPAIHPDQAVVDLGAAATIVIPASAPEDQYQLMLDAAPVKPAALGNNADLRVITDPLTADAAFEVVVTRPGDKGVQVERVVEVRVAVRPDTALAVSARQSAVAAGTGTDVLVDSSQPGVVYRLMSGQNPVGDPVAGTGAGIALPTGPIAADTTFSVAASRGDDPQVTVVLKAQATVQVSAGT
jgi:hypothetical protein